MLNTALSYLITIIRDSKGGELAYDEFSTAVWNWMKPIFIVDEEETKNLKDLKADHEDELNQEGALLEIKKYLKKNPSQKDTLQELLTSINKSNIAPSSQNMFHYGTGDIIGRDKIINNK